MMLLCKLIIGSYYHHVVLFVCVLLFICGKGPLPSKALLQPEFRIEPYHQDDTTSNYSITESPKNDPPELKQNGTGLRIVRSTDPRIVLKKRALEFEPSEIFWQDETWHNGLNWVWPIDWMDLLGFQFEWIFRSPYIDVGKCSSSVSDMKTYCSYEIFLVALDHIEWYLDSILPDKIEIAKMLAQAFRCASKFLVFQERYCPTLCQQELNPCQEKYFARIHSCREFSHDSIPMSYDRDWDFDRLLVDFTCACENGFVFDTSIHECVKESACRSAPCKVGRYISCVDLPWGAYECHCKPEWMGMKCENPVDKCMIDADICKPYGACVPTRSAPYFYTCQCTEGWIDNPLTANPDCNWHMSQECINLMCQHGYCVSNTMSSSPCHCSRGYTGPYCHERVSQFSSWYEWSECSVTCGPGVRYRERMCDKENGVPCVGPHRELMDCHRPPCSPDGTSDDGGGGEWTSWIQGSVCSHRCGGGHRVMIRLCQIEVIKTIGRMVSRDFLISNNCPGPPLGYRACNEDPCGEEDPPKRHNEVSVEREAIRLATAHGYSYNAPGLTDWFSWSPCYPVSSNDSTGVCSTPGHRVRFRMCVDRRGCADHHLHKVKHCLPEDCQHKPELLYWLPWGQWSPCSDTLGTCIRTRDCAYTADDGGHLCTGDSQQISQCQDDICSEEDEIFSDEFLNYVTEFSHAMSYH